MKRQLISIVLMMAITLFGSISHAAISRGMQAMSAHCEHDQTAHTTSTQCGASDHAESAACMTACVGSIVSWSQPTQTAPITLHPLAYPTARPTLHQGRIDETADRPPKPI